MSQSEHVPNVVMPGCKGRPVVMQKSGKSNTEEEEAGESEGLLADAMTNSDMGNMAVLFDKSPPRLEFQNTSGDSDESPKVEIVNGTPSETQRWKLMQDVAGGEVSALPHAHRLADPSTSDVGYVGAFVRMLQQLSAPRNESEGGESEGEESKVLTSTTEESEGGQSEEEDSERVASQKQESAAVADTCGRVAIVCVDVGSRTQFLAAPMAGVSLPPSWSLGLAAIIPTALTVGLLGYPLAMAPPLRAESSQRPPDAELYLRWLQAAACLPALQLALPPWTYSEAVEEAAYKALRFREEVVLPRVLASLEGAARDLRAVARPLWWDAPRDEAAQVVDSEFLVGDDLLVAPVVTSGAPAIRDIYLPAGRWRDGLAGGSTISGPTWLRRYSVPLESIPHFTRVR
ncbi:PREDICTED: uncharacterized protein LOC106814153 [Priapulus caudatus]|uniref:Uncharacterized protein LOC106814153 n=1 Tax=Priapulus caudatus TaxID=37621 RepID=A0ABM1EP12_PRICU|nr:PREDICTED: uncharacterized protein LOC106814153 [Priapulus caudatus]